MVLNEARGELEVAQILYETDELDISRAQVKFTAPPDYLALSSAGPFLGRLR